MEDKHTSMAQAGRNFADMVWPFYTELIRMGADESVALNLTFLLLKAALNANQK